MQVPIVLVGNLPHVTLHNPFQDQSPISPGKKWQNREGRLNAQDPRLMLLMRRIIINKPNFKSQYLFSKNALWKVFWRMVRVELLHREGEKVGKI